MEFLLCVHTCVLEIIIGIKVLFALSSDYQAHVFGQISSFASVPQHKTPTNPRKVAAKAPKAEVRICGGAR